MLNQVLFALILLVTCTVEGITGFGGGILALPFLDPLVGLKSAVPALAALGLINSSYRTFTLHKQIVKKELWTMVFFIVLGPGGHVGFCSFTGTAAENYSGRIYAVCSD